MCTTILRALTPIWCQKTAQKNHDANDECIGFSSFSDDEFSNDSEGGGRELNACVATFQVYTGREENERERESAHERGREKGERERARERQRERKGERERERERERKIDTKRESEKARERKEREERKKESV